ncbi:hypothetical protein M5K25_022889 [Dendrobium thyrsiflorum]|uniref:Uncharacterized protein n=1 Tax=Dendrobium thyrsiflorum TaxID=117978 RepID=A0ABD0U6Y4_DENTH
MQNVSIAMFWLKLQIYMRHTPRICGLVEAYDSKHKNEACASIISYIDEDIDKRYRHPHPIPVPLSSLTKHPTDPPTTPAPDDQSPPVASPGLRRRQWLPLPPPTQACMADPEVDHGFAFDQQGRTNILRSQFFDVYFSHDEIANDYIDRILYQLSLSIEEHIHPGRWIIVGRPPLPHPPATTPPTKVFVFIFLVVISILVWSIAALCLRAQQCHKFATVVLKALFYKQHVKFLQNVNVVEEHTGSDNDRNLMVSLGGKITRSEGSRKIAILSIILVGLYLQRCYVWNLVHHKSLLVHLHEQNKELEQNKESSAKRYLDRVREKVCGKKSNWWKTRFDKGRSKNLEFDME